MRAGKSTDPDLRLARYRTWNRDKASFEDMRTVATHALDWASDRCWMGAHFR